MTFCKPQRNQFYDALLAGQHGVGVALDGVDLAVVQDEAVGGGAHPAGVGVGREAAVHHADGRLRSDGYIHWTGCRGFVGKDRFDLTDK